MPKSLSEKERMNAVNNTSFNLKQFKIDLTSEIPHLKNLVNNTRLSTKALYPNAGPEKGTELDFLGEPRTEWLETFDWETQREELNHSVAFMPHRFKQYTAVTEGQTVHFVHQKSVHPDAIPVILLHGWPGYYSCSFHEFLPVINPLTQSWTSTTGKNVSYNVVIPSLPGFVFSSLLPANWTVADTARIFSALMTEVHGNTDLFLQHNSARRTFRLSPVFPSDSLRNRRESPRTSERASTFAPSGMLASAPRFSTHIHAA
ncbi:Alpha/Beta hydrolase protein [Mycena vulgaris]|nr:Alpha/Beta hydrolase protein [Mycena vulgaris]